MNEEKDPITNPAHYTQGQYECWDAMKYLMGPELVSDFCIGCAFKYIWREELKNSSVEDIEKAIVYLNKYAEINKIKVSNCKALSLHYVQFYPYYKSHKSEESSHDYYLIRAFDCLITFYTDQKTKTYLYTNLLTECMANLNAWLLIKKEDI